MKRFQFLIKLFNFDYIISNDIYHIYPKKPISLNSLCFKVGLFTKFLKLTSVNPDYCAMYSSKIESNIWLGLSNINKFYIEGDN